MKKYTQYPCLLLSRKLEKGASLPIQTKETDFRNPIVIQQDNVTTFRGIYTSYKSKSQKFILVKHMQCKLNQNIYLSKGLPAISFLGKSWPMLFL